MSLLGSNEVIIHVNGYRTDRTIQRKSGVGQYSAQSVHLYPSDQRWAMTQSLYERAPRSVLFLGPFIILGAAIALLAITSPLGDLEAIETATTSEVLGTMVLIGLIVGIIPVAIGMLWFPFMRTLDHSKLHIVLALSAGVLAFVGV